MNAIVLLWLSAVPLSAAGIELLSSSPRALFGEGTQFVEVVFRNTTAGDVDIPVELQLLQTSSATATSWSAQVPWRVISLRARQTALERAQIELPAVRARSQFLVRFTSAGQVLGTVALRVYPKNLLTNLTATAGPVAVSCGKADLNQVLRDAGLTLTDSALPSLSEKRQQYLAIYGPEFPANETPARIAEAVSLAKTGMGVVLILSDGDDERRRTAPSYYPTRMGKGLLVTVREAALNDVVTDPGTQLRLARIIRLALGKETLNPPDSDL